MAIIKQYNSKNDTTYVYESVSYWDKDLKQPRSKRKLIGKIDPVTGEIVPTSGRRGRKPKKASDAPKPELSGSVSQNVPDTDAPLSAQADGSDIQSLYEDCRRRLLETEASLAKAESTIAKLTSEKQELRKELEQILKRLRP